MYCLVLLVVVILMICIRCVIVKTIDKQGTENWMLHQSPSEKPNLRAGAQAPFAALRFGFSDGL